MKPRNRQHRSLNVSSSRWLAYATAGLATAAANVPSVEAEIHYFSPVHLHLKGGAESFRVPLTGGANISFYRFAESAPGFRADFLDVVQISRNAAVHAIRERGESGDAFYASNLRAGSNVSGGRFISTFCGLDGPFFDQFVRPEIGFVGFKFDVGNGVQYGWVRMRTNKGGRAVARMTVLDYAFADPGEPIKAGQTSDEPVTGMDSLGLLAAGAAGLTAWRKSRRSVSSAAP